MVPVYGVPRRLTRTTATSTRRRIGVNRRLDISTRIRTSTLAIGGEAVPLGVGGG